MDNDLSLTGQRRHVSGATGLLRPYAESLVLVGGSTLAGMLVAPRWGNSPVDLLYLPAVLGAAGIYGLGPGIFAAIASALAFNYYFTLPYHTFQIDRPQDVATVAMLFLVALVTSQLAARMRRAMEDARASAERNATIAGFARRLLSCSSEEQVGLVACRELQRLLGCNAALAVGLPEPAVVAARPVHVSLTPADVAAAAWAMESGRPSGKGAEAAPATEWLFLPVRSDSGVLAAIGLARDDGVKPIPPGEGQLVDSLIDQVALALERARLEDEARDFAATRERDKTRSSLLSTIGQDMGPHLSAIVRAANGLIRSGSEDKELAAAIRVESTRLERYLGNLRDVGAESDDQPLQAGAVTIDLFHRTVRKAGEDVHLTPKEYAVLAELAKHPGRVLSHGHLLRTAWGPAHESQADYLRVAIRALRRKLEDDPARPALILNEPAVGYRLAV